MHKILQWIRDEQIPIGDYFTEVAAQMIRDFADEFGVEVYTRVDDDGDLNVYGSIKVEMDEKFYRADIYYDFNLNTRRETDEALAAELLDIQTRAEDVLNFLS